VVALAAAVSSRSQLPWLAELESGRVLVLSAEDDPARNGAGAGRPPMIRWLGIDEELGPEHLLNRPPRERGRPDDAREEAKELLRDLLSDGEKLKSQIEAASEARSISRMTLRRAAADLGVRKYKQGGKGFRALPHAQKSQG
jgi:hypothetical protein